MPRGAAAGCPPPRISLARPLLSSSPPPRTATCLGWSPPFAFRPSAFHPLRLPPFRLPPLSPSALSPSAPFALPSPPFLAWAGRGRRRRRGGPGRDRDPDHGVHLRPRAGGAWCGTPCRPAWRGRPGGGGLEGVAALTTRRHGPARPWTPSTPGPSTTVRLGTCPSARHVHGMCRSTPAVHLDTSTSSVPSVHGVPRSTRAWTGLLVATPCVRLGLVEQTQARRGGIPRTCVRGHVVTRAWGRVATCTLVTTLCHSCAIGMP